MKHLYRFSLLLLFALMGNQLQAQCTPTQNLNTLGMDPGSLPTVALPGHSQTNQDFTFFMPAEVRFDTSFTLQGFPLTVDISYFPDTLVIDGAAARTSGGFGVPLAEQSSITVSFNGSDANMYFADTMPNPDTDIRGCMNADYQVGDATPTGTYFITPTGSIDGNAVINDFSDSVGFALPIQPGDTLDFESLSDNIDQVIGSVGIVAPPEAITFLKGVKPENFLMNSMNSRMEVQNPTSRANEDLARELQLRVFPNPATTQSRLRYDLPKPARVEVNLLDLTGRRVRQVLDAEQAATKHQVELCSNCQELGSGLYLVEILVDGQRMTRKLSLTQ